ncbi:hypothetical protein EYC80_001251 [Monilinia laxa]|uniref:Uncharacterized protein n=1 Tax=Monilinia laxa TaxID=61186 RepID=A0A5N6K8Q3_MONLA|nr:hypothetical protein EYC80_001251 [Monilinia laxa]
MLLSQSKIPLETAALRILRNYLRPRDCMIDQYFVFSIPPIQGNFFNKLSHHPILTNIRFLSSARSFNISRSAHHNGH